MIDDNIISEYEAALTEYDSVKRQLPQWFNGKAPEYRIDDISMFLASTELRLRDWRGILATSEIAYQFGYRDLAISSNTFGVDGIWGNLFGNGTENILAHFTSDAPDISRLLAERKSMIDRSVKVLQEDYIRGLVALFGDVQQIDTELKSLIDPAYMDAVKQVERAKKRVSISETKLIKASRMLFGEKLPSLDNMGLQIVFGRYGINGASSNVMRQSGVYVLIHQQIEYIGQSVNIFNRLSSSHHVYDPLTHRVIGVVPQHEDKKRLALERKMINYYQPRRNIR